MKRLHLIELHEQPWYPAALRRMFQDSLGYVATRMGVFDNLTPHFAALLQRVGADAVLDLCSGASGPVVRMCQGVAKHSADQRAPTIMLSDLFPNLPRFSALQRAYRDTITYRATPVDATRVPHDDDLPRVRTVFAALHHFKPEQARAILADAAATADGIAIFESTGRTWKNLLFTLTIPAASLVVGAFLLRPWRPTHLLFGLILPVAPLTAFVDSVVSNLRTYTPAELQAMVDDIDAPDFIWEIGTVPMPHTPLHATYLFGWRRSVAAARAQSSEAEQKEQKMG